MHRGERASRKSCVCKRWSSSTKHDSLAERSKAVAQGAIPKGRGFEPHSCHFLIQQSQVGVHQTFLRILRLIGSAQRHGSESSRSDVGGGGGEGQMTLAGLEPAIFGSEDRRLIH